MIQPTLNVRDLRNQLADSVNRVAYAKRPIVVTKHGRPVVAIINMEDYERVINPRSRFATQSAWDEGFQIVDRIRAANKDKSGEKIDKLVSKAVAETRDQSRN